MYQNDNVPAHRFLVTCGVHVRHGHLDEWAQSCYLMAWSLIDTKGFHYYSTFQLFGNGDVF